MRLSVVKGFMGQAECQELLRMVGDLGPRAQTLYNPHIRTVRSELKGESYMYDLSKTPASSYLAAYQSSENLQDTGRLPKKMVDLADEVAASAGIPAVNKFVQVIVQGPGGKIRRHYDSCYPGHVNFKCNLAVLSEDYAMWVDKVRVDVSQGDLYCFEASLYPHWTERFERPRVLLSYGFAVPYADLGLAESDPRVRLSERIYKVFQEKWGPKGLSGQKAL